MLCANLLSVPVFVAVVGSADWVGLVLVGVVGWRLVGVVVVGVVGVQNFSPCFPLPIS